MVEDDSAWRDDAGVGRALVLLSFCFLDAGPVDCSCDWDSVRLDAEDADRRDGVAAPLREEDMEGVVARGGGGA